jgi:hypothetical protein
MHYLSGERAARLSAALREVFSHDDFAQLLYFALGRRLEDITLGASFEARVFDVIQKAEREGWILPLIDAAYNARPMNAALARIRDELTSVPAELDRPSAREDATDSQHKAGSQGWSNSPGLSGSGVAAGSGGTRHSGTGLGELLLQVRLRGARGQLVVGFGAGDMVVVVDHDGAVYRWRIGDQTGLTALQRGERLRDGIHVAISTTEPAIAFARPGTLTVARLDDGLYRIAAQVPLGQHEFIARGAGERFATYDGRRVAVRDFRDGAVLWEQPCPPSLATVAVDPTGTVVATADGRLGANGSKVSAGARDKARLHGFTLANVPLVGPGCVLGLSPGGELLAAASLREVVLVRPRTGEVAFRRPLQGFRKEMAPALGARPQQLIPAPDGAVLWLRGRRVAVIRGADDDLHYLPQDGDIDDVAFDYARSRLATVNSDGLVSVWRWWLARSGSWAAFREPGARLGPGHDTADQVVPVCLNHAGQDAGD